MMEVKVSVRREHIDSGWKTDDSCPIAKALREMGALRPLVRLNHVHADLKNEESGLWSTYCCPTPPDVADFIVRFDRHDDVSSRGRFFSEREFVLAMERCEFAGRW